MSESTLDHSRALEARVETALESIRGYLQADGGDVRVHRVDGVRVELELLGACRACSMSAMTMKSGVERAILQAVPEIKEVVTVNNFDGA